MPVDRAPVVLVVDDDPVILRLLTVTFEMEGFSVLSASNGQEGIDTAISERPDVVITDIMMPKVDGLGVLAQLKAHEATAGTPIILLSARAQTADVRKGLEAGADDYVTKPFEPFDLIDLVNKLLDRHPD
jgi:DNA-binding response OmpR family regulator